MKIEHISRTAIMSAIDEFDRLGRLPFLEKYHFGLAREYFLIYNGKKYDSKAIVGAAHGYELAEEGPLRPADFSGGQETVGRLLERLGFKVTTPDRATPVNNRNPNWTRDEVILALEFYMSHRDHIPGPGHSELLELVQDVQTVAHELGLSGNENFRNANGVYMKIMNIRSIDPSYPEGGGLSAGGRLEKQIWEQFSGDLPALRRAATAIRSGIVAMQASESLPHYDEPEIAEAAEGRLLTRLHRYRERNRKLVSDKKKSVLRSYRTLECEACGFDFKKVYGERGEGFIECHHTKPLASMEPGEKTKLADLALVCANCHRMIHAKQPWLTIEELRKLLH